MCRLFLREFARMPIELDVYATAPLSDLPELLPCFDNRRRRYIPFLFEWDWSAWYGRNRKTAFVMNFIKRLPIHRRVVKALMREHRKRPYDVVIQFSQGELFSLRDYIDEIPVVLFPCVHAAGELQWCRKEAALARRCESLWWRCVRDLYLALRSRLQSRDYKQACGVIGMSRRFNRLVQRDYGVPEERMGVAYHPIEVSEDSSVHQEAQNRIRLLFVGRVSVRKGVDLLVEIVPRILRQHPEVELTVIGAGSLWSDYECLLGDLPDERCRWLKSLPNDQVTEEMRKSDILLVPSLYEPGGIVVGEALANGMIVVASDEVGSAENLPASICQEFPAGDAEGFQIALRRAIERIRDARAHLRMEATRVAREQFDPAKMAHLLMEEVKRLISVPRHDAEV